MKWNGASGDFVNMVAPLPRYLFVDLDGSLIKTDLLYEALIRLVFRAPWVILLLPFYLMRGKSHFKTFVFSRYGQVPKQLPLNNQVLKIIYEAKTEGKKIVLATATHMNVARSFADSLGLFDEVIASHNDKNLKGLQKYQEIKRCSQGEAFAYLGDASCDLAIWEKAALAYVVSPSRILRLRLKRLNIPTVILEPERYQGRSRLKTFLKQIRMYQWSKNILLFLPLITAHRFWEYREWLSTFYAFLAFSLVASTVYMVNDLGDLDNDRQHPSKKNRPIAHGDFSILLAVGLMPVFLLMACLFSWTLPPAFLFWLIAYFFSNLLYSFWLKKIVIIDVVFLSLLYTLRIHAGGAVSNTPISHWLLAFSTFFFLSLAFVKRYAEIAKGESKGDLRGRGYKHSDQIAIFTFGCSTSFLAILVLVLYLNSTDVKALYNHSDRVWFMMPILLYWVARLWLLAHRREVDDDPVVFAIRDPITWGVTLVLAGILLMAI